MSNPLRPLLDLLRYWRSLGFRPFLWGWIPALITVGLLFALGLWAIPLIVLVFGLFAYLTSGTRERL